jgi:hypothetical protein
MEVPLCFPLPSKLGTYKRVRTRIWSWLPAESWSQVFCMKNGYNQGRNLALPVLCVPHSPEFAHVGQPSPGGRGVFERLFVDCSRGGAAVH